MCTVFAINFFNPTKHLQSIEKAIVSVEDSLSEFQQKSSIPALFEEFFIAHYY